jgi:MFS family permease
MVIVAAAVSTITTPFFGYASDVIGRKRMYLLGAAAMILFAMPYWWLLDSREPVLVFLAILLSLPVHDMQYGPQAAFIAESFTARVRFTGASLGYHLAVLLGGWGPFVALTLPAGFTARHRLASMLLDALSSASWQCLCYAIEPNTTCQRSMRTRRSRGRRRPSFHEYEVLRFPGPARLRRCAGHETRRQRDAVTP